MDGHHDHNYATSAQVNGARQNGTTNQGTSPQSPVEKDYNIDHLDFSDGEGGDRHASYDINSDKESQGDSVCDHGSYSPHNPDSGDDETLLGTGTYRRLGENAHHDEADAAPAPPLVPGGGLGAGDDMCDDSESEFGSYHINTDNDEDGHTLSQNDSNAEYDLSSGVESDYEDTMDDVELLRLKYHRRQINPALPETVTVLESETGAKVYLIGTAHFSERSHEDVAQTIEAVQPDIVMVELCKGRLSILQLDEETLLREAKDLNTEKFMLSMKQHGFIGGVMQLLLLNLSAHLTKELGMAPGGEFRRAFKEAQKIPGCKVHLGDRPIQITLNRAMGALTPWQKLRLAWYLITSKDPITKEEVEKCKQKDLLMEMLEEMTGEFPALSEVFVTERDTFLTASLKACAQPIPNAEQEGDYVRPVVVGVVGIGHLPGIKECWNKQISIPEIQRIMSVPPPSLTGRLLRWTIRASILGLFAWGSYRCIKWTGLKLW
ncbi:traB domain-containing protein-like [Amphiura filiformis]|uniref:traB domain-containing protein-like n=1 Tax=Amphiura filiformis TaxID=82378 RepID=UPI003B214C3B